MTRRKSYEVAVRSVPGLLCVCFPFFFTPPVKLFQISWMMLRFVLFGFGSPFAFSFFHSIFSLLLLLIYGYLLSLGFLFMSMTLEQYFADKSTQTKDCVCLCNYHIRRSPCLQILLLIIAMLVKGTLVFSDLMKNGSKCLISVSYLVPFSVASQLREDEPALELVEQLEDEFMLINNKP